MKTIKFINYDSDGNRLATPPSRLISFTCRECGYKGVGKFWDGVKPNRKNKCPKCKAQHMKWGNEERAKRRLEKAKAMEA
jgi:predicted Zn-ribbon and HTH transcriptional regulator